MTNMSHERRARQAVTDFDREREAERQGLLDAAAVVNDELDRHAADAHGGHVQDWGCTICQELVEHENRLIEEFERG